MTEFIEKDGYLFRRSTRRFKKYDVFTKDMKYITSFGDIRYQSYKDAVGLYKKLDHGDERRRERYYQRHGKTAKKNTAKYFSHKYLW